MCEKNKLTVQLLFARSKWRQTSQKKRELIGKCKNGNKSCVAAHFASGWVWRILLLPLPWSLVLIPCWLQVSGEVCCLHRSNRDSHTSWASQHPAAASGSWQHLLRSLAEKRKVKRTSRCWKIYRKASVRWKRWRCCMKWKLLDAFNVLASAKSCRRGFRKRWASPWGEDQHEGEEPLHFQARRLWFRRRKWNWFCFLFTSHSRRFLLLSLH